MRTLHAVAVAFAIAAAAPVIAQGTYSVGVHDVAWPNTSGQGTALLDARVHYPADYAGIDAPWLQQPGGWPAVVFLHGHSQLGTDYAAIGDRLAASGIVAVMLNTAEFDYIVMEHDARAMFSAIEVANTLPLSLLEGIFDIDRIGLMGHSMGGGVVAYVLFHSPGHPLHNPGYLCGLAVSPVNPGLPATMVQAPFGIVSGAGDFITPPAFHAEPFYAALAPAEGLKFHYQMSIACGHMNVIGLEPQHPDVFDRVAEVSVGFFGQFLCDDPIALEGAFGPAAATDPNLEALDCLIATPQIWADSILHIGQTTRVSLIAEFGIGGMIGAGSKVIAPVPTPIGDLLLDPAAAFALAPYAPVYQRMDIVIDVPNNTSLIGTPFSVQGLGATSGAPLLLGSTLEFVIE